MVDYFEIASFRKPCLYLFTPKHNKMTVKPHVPMIKFRKGGSPQKHADAGHSSSPSVVHAGAPQTKSGHVVSRPLIEDYQLPARYRRQGIDQAEIDAINSGGAL